MGLEALEPRLMLDGVTQVTHAALSTTASLAPTPAGLEAAPVNEEAIGETGQLANLTHVARTVLLQRSYVNPVVIAQSPSFANKQPVVVRISNVQSNQFTIRLQEPPNLDRRHPIEQVTYLVLESGLWRLGDGTLLEAGTIDTTATVGRNVADAWEFVPLAGAFTDTPLIMTQTQTATYSSFVSTRQRNNTRTGFNVALEEEESASAPHGIETIGYLAMQTGSGQWSGRTFEAGYTPDAVTDAWHSLSFSAPFVTAPRLLSSVASYDDPDSSHVRYQSLTASGAKVKVEEDTTFDGETRHASEVLGYLAIEGQGILLAYPMDLIGEAGQIANLTHQSRTIILRRSYVNPVVFAQTASYNGGHPTVARITDVRSDRFTVQLQEPPNLDGIHVAEIVNYLVIEAGLWQLADGTRLDVGLVHTQATVGGLLFGQWESIALGTTFFNRPAVFSQVQTNNDPSYVTTRQQFVSSFGFAVAMEQEEAADTLHGAETIGYLAISPGAGQWGDQAFQAGLTGNTIAQKPRALTFSATFASPPIFLSSLASYNNTDSAHVRTTQVTSSRALVFAEEDTSLDNETIHPFEAVSYLALAGAGQLKARSLYDTPATPTSHPLVPGVRTDDVWQPDWPRTLHDKQITGFSPLVLGMTGTPAIWSTIDTGDAPRWTQQVTRQNGQTVVLIFKSKLQMLTLAGDVLWTSDAPADSLQYFGNLRGNGHDYILTTSGATLHLINGQTGILEWSFTFNTDADALLVSVADVLPGQPGLEAAVFESHGVKGGLLQFPSAGNPTVVWTADAINPNDPWAYSDHGVSIRLDLTIPAQPMIWNLRHHRLIGFDARNGAKVSVAEYTIGGASRRNYGPWDFGTGPNGEPLVIVVAEAVELHVHALQLNRNGPSTVLWQHHYGSVYEQPGTVVKMVLIDDIDGDGVTDVVYNVRDPAAGFFRSFVRVRDGMTGAVKAELDDQWAVGTFDDVGDNTADGLLILPAPNGPIPDAGDTTMYRFNSSILSAALTTNANDVVLEESTTTLDQTDAPALLQQNDVSQLAGAFGPATMSAADLDGDGNAELIVASRDQRLRIYSFDQLGNATEIANYEYRAPIERHAPLLYDLDGNGDWIVIAPGSTSDNHMTIRAYRGDGSLLWETPLPFTTANNTQVIAVNVGDALPGGKPAVVVSLTDSLRTVQDSVGINGETGQILWSTEGTFNGLPYRPEGIVTASDVDNDGLDELANDMLAFMAFFNGEDGSFALLQSDGDLPAATLYNSFIPLYSNPGDQQPYWLVPSGFGTFGMMGPDFSARWTVSADYDVPGHVGLIDVDGDGVLEAGYALKNDNVFVVRNVWTGQIEQQLTLPTAPNSPVLTVDVDGDGKGEFLAGRYVMGVNQNGQLEVKFELPVSLTVSDPWSYEFLKDGSLLIADFDGDGFGEIATTQNGSITILRSASLTT